MTRKRFNKLMRAYLTETYRTYATTGIDINKLYRRLRNCKVVDKAIYAYSPYQYIYDVHIGKISL